MAENTAEDRARGRMYERLNLMPEAHKNTSTYSSNVGRPSSLPVPISTLRGYSDKTADRQQAAKNPITAHVARVLGTRARLFMHRNTIRTRANAAVAQARNIYFACVMLV